MEKTEYKEKMIRWAEVLESGKYQQKHGGWGSLEEGKLCCLNVALVEFTGIDSGPNIMTAQSSASHIFGKEYSWGSLFVEMNDVKKMSFLEIAQEIRKMARRGK